MSTKIIELQIKDIIQDRLKPSVLEITNESDLHSGPKGRESHFKVLIVSEAFKDVKRIDRQKLIFKFLKDIMSQVHALSLRCLTESEFKKAKDFKSPDCTHRS